MTTPLSSPTARGAVTDRERHRTAALELRRELARVERGLAPHESSDEREELLLALQRVDDGSYGICMTCARRIPEERLEVMPATRWCVHCRSAA